MRGDSVSKESVAVWAVPEGLRFRVYAVVTGLRRSSGVFGDEIDQLVATHIVDVERLQWMSVGDEMGLQ